MAFYIPSIFEILETEGIIDSVPMINNNDIEEERFGKN